MVIKIVTGDITERDDDIIVNAANEVLLAGSGVCGAIHRAAGENLEAACRSLGHCPTGSAVITPAFNLKAKYIIHAVGPRWWDGSRGEVELLEKCYHSIFELMKNQNLKTIALPAISTGIYRFPLKMATDIAVSSARKFDSDDKVITFVCFSNEAEQVYRRVLAV